jgi:hypothetical protein
MGGAGMSYHNITIITSSVESPAGVNGRLCYAGTRPTGSRPVGSHPQGSRPPGPHRPVRHT